MKGKPIFIWGTGSAADRIISECSVFEQYDVIGFIDNDIQKIGKTYKNHMVYSLDILEKECPDKIVILSKFYEEIRKQIIDRFPNLQKKIEDINYFYKDMLLKRYKDSNDCELNRVLDYIKTNGLDVFNYEFTGKYKDLKVNVSYDEICEMFFVYHNGKRMYFARQYDTEDKAEAYYRYLLLEQDEASPHRYLTNEFNVKRGDVVLDAGAAEGNFSLEIVEKASKIYLIETDEGWVEALKETFKDYQEKIVIIQKYLTSLNAGKYATLDSLVKEPVNFIKMDIEGNEWDALLGADNLLKRSDDLKCAICAYHQEFDETLIKAVMERYDIECSAAKGYMWFPYGIRQTYMPTRLCRGIIRGIKKIS